MVLSDVESLIMGHAHRIWSETYGSGKGEEAALDAARSLALEMLDPDAVDTSGTDFFRFAFAIHWIHGGCVKVTTGEKFAAALCASRTGGQALAGVRMPAAAFRVQVPPGLLSNEEHQLDFTQVNCMQLEGGRSLFMLEGLGAPVRAERGRRLASMPVWSNGADSLEQLLARAGEDDDELEMRATPEALAQMSADERAVRGRMLDVARKLVGGLLLAYTHTESWRELGAKSRRRKTEGRSGPPPHRTIFIGRPIGLDVRPAIAAYLGGRRSSVPSVQTLVRGHHKRQVIGAGGGGRKVIWIEPYWRGPEDAPILSRPIRVGGRP